MVLFQTTSTLATDRYSVGRILESDTLYYFLFHVGYKYPTYNSNGSFSDDLYTGYGQVV